MNRENLTKVLGLLSESAPVTLQESLTQYAVIEEATQNLGALIDQIGFEVQSTTVDELAEEADAIWAEASEEMTPEQQEDFKQAVFKMKGALTKLKGHMSKLGSRMKGGYHDTMSKHHHQKELGSALKAAKAYKKGDDPSFQKQIQKAGFHFDKGSAHGQKAHQSFSAARGAVARSQKKHNPYGGIGGTIKARKPRNTGLSVSGTPGKKAMGF